MNNDKADPEFERKREEAVKEINGIVDEVIAHMSKARLVANQELRPLTTDEDLMYWKIGAILGLHIVLLKDAKSLMEGIKECL